MTPVEKAYQAAWGPVIALAGSARAMQEYLGELNQAPAGSDELLGSLLARISALHGDASRAILTLFQFAVALDPARMAEMDASTRAFRLASNLGGTAQQWIVVIQMYRQEQILALKMPLLDEVEIELRRWWAEDKAAAGESPLEHHTAIGSQASTPDVRKGIMAALYGGWTPSRVLASLIYLEAGSPS